MRFIAHRGYSRRFPENTLPAFAAVVAHPCIGTTLTGIELDIHLSADGRIVVMHDTGIAGTGGAYDPVGTLAFDEVQRRYGVVHGDGYPGVPELHEVLQTVAHRTELCLEIKTGEYDPDRFTTVLAKILEGYRPAGDVTVSSYSVELLERVMQSLAGAAVTYAVVFRTWEAWESLQDDFISRLHYLHPAIHLVCGDPERLTAAPLPLRPWTVNDPAVVRSLLRLPRAERIRAVMTDDISLAERFPER